MQKTRINARIDTILRKHGGLNKAELKEDLLKFVDLIKAEVFLKHVDNISKCEEKFIERHVNFVEKKEEKSIEPVDISHSKNLERDIQNVLSSNKKNYDKIYLLLKTIEEYNTWVSLDIIPNDLFHLFFSFAENGNMGIIFDDENNKFTVKKIQA